MVRIFRHYVSPVKLAMAITDLMLLLFAVFLAEWLRYQVLEIQAVQSMASIFAKAMVPVITILVLLGVGGYESIALRDMRVFLLRLLIGVGGASIILSAFLFLFPMLPLWRSILLLAIVIGGGLVFLSHVLFKRIAGQNFLGRKVIVLGADEAANSVLEMTGRAADAALNIVSVVALPGDKIDVTGAVLLENIGSLEEYVRKSQAELILIANSQAKGLPVEDLIACKLNGVEIQDRLAFYEQVRGYVDLESVKAEWIIFSEGFRGGSSLERLWKRLSDIVVSFVALVLFSPIMLVTAIAIMLTSKGPILYRQERVGLDGDVFNLLKFRSMRVDAEAEGKPQWAQKADPRVTLVGGFIRRTRIDELPQVINVLKGDMSFVGPRPERPFFVDQLTEDIPFYKERHCLKPGITGWAQIQYPYGASMEDSKRKLEYDLYYIKNYSIFLDFLIILQTLRVVLFPVGAR